MDEYEDDVGLSSPSPNGERDEKKPELKPEGSQPDGDDDDVYEDSLDLDTTDQQQRVMLVRLPEYLMTKLKENGDELSGADLGKVLIPQGPDADPKKLRVLLNPQIELLRPLPHRYDMNVVNQDVENVFVMKEQETKRRNPDQEGGEGFKRAKRTALVGHAVNECSLTADMSDPNYSYVLQQRKLMELPSADRQTVLLDSMAGVGGSKYGATLRSQKEAWRKPIQKRQLARQFESKATRLPRNELLDVLFRAFEEQPYWAMRQLRERSRQPEVYLRSVLDSIAVLIKRGPYAMKYGLREEYKVLQSHGASVESMVEKAPMGPDISDSEARGDHDSDDMEMENVEIV